MEIKQWQSATNNAINVIKTTPHNSNEQIDCSVNYSSLTQNLWAPPTEHVVALHGFFDAVVYIIIIFSGVVAYKANNSNQRTDKTSVN